MDKQEWSIKDIDPNNEILLHGGKWSEEAKRRVSEARRAGRSVLDMFGDLYKKTEKTAESAANTASKTVGNLVRVAKKGVFQTTSKTTTGTVGSKSGDKALSAAGYKARKIDPKLVKRLQDKLNRRYVQGKYKKTEAQKLDQTRGKAMDKREKRNKSEAKAKAKKMKNIDQARGKAMDKREQRKRNIEKAHKKSSEMRQKQNRKLTREKTQNRKKQSGDAIANNTREKFRNGDLKSGNEALIRKYRQKMKDYMKKSPDERRKASKDYNNWNQRVKELQDQNKRLASRNKGSKLEENNTRKMENMYESSKNASASIRRRNAARTRDLENENESYYSKRKKNKSLKQSATFDYQAALSTVSKKKNQNELSHSGIRGMRWGVRKSKTVSPQQKQFSKKMNKLSKKRDKADFKLMRRFEKDKDFKSQAEKSGYYKISKTSPDRTYEFYKIVATNKGNLAGRYYKMDSKINAKYLKRKHNIIRGIK